MSVTIPANTEKPLRCSGGAFLFVAWPTEASPSVSIIEEFITFN